MGENKGRARRGMKTIEPREGRADGNVPRRKEKRRRERGERRGEREKGAGVDLKCSVNEVCYLVLRACIGRGQGEDKGSLGKSAEVGFRCGDAKVDS